MRRLTMVSAVLCIMLAGASVAGAQSGAIGNDGGSILRVPRPDISLKSMSLLDPTRFTMRQESIVSYSSSSSMGGNLMGMYINTMEYRFNMPLTMRLKVAYQNNMGNLMGNRSLNSTQHGMDTGRMFVPVFDLVYQPWEHTTISFHYRDFSAMSASQPYSMYSPYGRYYYDPYGIYR